ncbi:hypothetical protein HQQ81_14085 [Microbacteriaceae bacterium VKM Ac-2854]|nr:hypothetical protein [Microbacteriaceae bacterium VKM Ac-2854]
MTLDSLPVPPGVDEIAARFGAPLITFRPQSRLEEFNASEGRALGRAVHLSLSYSYFPDPAARIRLRPDQEAAIDAVGRAAVPAWILEQIERLRRPVLWETVRTSLAVPSERNNPIESRLAAHLNDVLRTSFADATRAVPSVGRRLDERALTRGVVFSVDGEPTRGVRYDAHPRVIGMGARVDGRYVTVVIDRAIAPTLRMEFVRRPCRLRDRPAA